MGNTKLDPRSLNAEERAIVDHEASRFHRDWTGEARYEAALSICEPIILARRAIFGEPASEPAKVEPATAISPHGVWRCECCAEIADPMDPRFRWNGECWQHHHAEAQTHFDCRFFGPQPEPVAAYHAAPMMGFPCANCGQETLRMDGHVSHRASGDETEYYCDKLSQPEPVAEEMPEAVREAARILRVASKGYVGFTVSFLNSKADALESFWRTHAAQPAKARMTEELERVLDAAEIAEEQARVAWVIQTPRSRTLKADIAAVRAHAAEAGKVRLPKVRPCSLRRSDRETQGADQ